MTFPWSVGSAKWKTDTERARSVDPWEGCAIVGRHVEESPNLTPSHESRLVSIVFP